PDTGPRDAVRLPAEQVDPAELHRSRRPGETGDRVHDRRLARTVGPDEEPEVARGDGEVDALDGDEPVELDAQPAHLEVVVPEARVVDAQDGLRGLEVEPVARDAGLEKRLSGARHRPGGLRGHAVLPEVAGSWSTAVCGSTVGSPLPGSPVRAAPGRLPSEVPSSPGAGAPPSGTEPRRERRHRVNSSASPPGRKATTRMNRAPWA